MYLKLQTLIHGGTVFAGLIGMIGLLVTGNWGVFFKMLLVSTFGAFPLAIAVAIPTIILALLSVGVSKLSKVLSQFIELIALAAMGIPFAGWALVLMYICLDGTVNYWVGLLAVTGCFSVPISYIQTRGSDPTDFIQSISNNLCQIAGNLSLIVMLIYSIFNNIRVIEKDVTLLADLVLVYIIPYTLLMAYHTFFLLPSLQTEFKDAGLE